MKRNMDTIRSLLLWMEEQETDMFVYFERPEMPDEETTRGHMKMLISGGFVDVSNKHTLRMSWDGHEFLDKVRDPEIWRQTKEGASRIGSWSVKFLGELAAGFIRAKAIELGLPI